MTLSIILSSVINCILDKLSYCPKINKAYNSIFDIIIRNLSTWMTVVLYYSISRMFQPHLEYANSVWCPFKQGNINELEKKFKKEQPNLL